jgi:methyl-accepting chemotaxis protein
VRELSNAAQKIGDIITDQRDRRTDQPAGAECHDRRPRAPAKAGKGFAVVASEVKNLATQTARATEDISRRSRRSRARPARQVEAIHGIANTIREIKSISDEMSSRVELQGGATRRSPK